MRKPVATFEWQISKDDQQWGQLAYPPPLTSSKPRRLPVGLAETLLLLLVIGGIGGWQWYTRWAAWQQRQTELTLAIQQETTVVPTFHLLDDAGDLAIVAVTPALQSNPQQTRLYRRTATGWQRTAPDAEAWGARQHLETASFRWDYHEQDAQLVTTVAPHLERLYATLRHTFGLGIGPADEKLGIEVSVTQQPDKGMSVWSVSKHLVVPTPALYRAPVDLSDTDLLAQAVALPLLNRVMAQAAERYQLDSTWQPLLYGLRLWQWWDLDLPLSTWRTPVVEWLYQDLPNAADQSVALPKAYGRLCAIHRLWLVSPMQIDIPLLCTALDHEPWYAATWGTPSLSTHLDQLGIPLLQHIDSADTAATDHLIPRGQSVALAMLIDYTVVAYGRERLPTLVASLGQYDSWDTLLPVVYGVPSTVFEAGWQKYLMVYNHQ